MSASIGTYMGGQFALGGYIGSLEFNYLLPTNKSVSYLYASRYLPLYRGNWIIDNPKNLTGVSM